EGVFSLAVYGGNLYAGGAFFTMNGVSCNRIARWNGAAWSPVGSPANGTSGSVFCMTVWNNQLAAGGLFFLGFGWSSCRAIGTWNGTAWGSLGVGFNGSVVGVAVLNGVLYAAGAFNISSPTTVNHIASWNPTTSSWQALGTGLDLTNQFDAEVHAFG